MGPSSGGGFVQLVVANERMALAAIVRSCFGVLVSEVFVGAWLCCQWPCLLECCGDPFRGLP